MAPQSGQLDQISQAIGELQGSLDAIEKYVHQNRHDGNNLSQKIDALGTRITRDIAAVEARIEVRITSMDNRVAALERASVRSETQKSTVAAILQSPIIGGIVGSILTWAALFFAWWRAGR